MKPREIAAYTLIFLATMGFAIDTASMGLRGQHILALPQLWIRSAKTYTTDGKCTDKPAITKLDQASTPELKALADYQTACGSSLVTATMMTFTTMPKDAAEAASMAHDMASRLKEFHRYGVRPLVVAEPTTSWGDIDFTEFKNGFYDPWIDTYFKALKAEGITDQEMGMWVPFPEANLPYWNHHNATAADFAPIINRYVGLQKHYFPGSKASIMLNSATYANDDFDWANGEYTSLVPYVKGIQKGLIDSFGLQGFPWAPQAGKAGAGIFDAGEYLNYRLAQEAADSLGVKDVWFNTGSFARKYTLDEHATITISPEKRKAILDGITAEVAKLRDKGYHVSVNLFAQDKSQVNEATDWSYWAKGKPLESPNSIVFHDFAKNLADQHIELWLFDR